MRPGGVVVGYCDAGKWSAVFGLSYRDVILHDVMASGSSSPPRIIREGGRELRALTGTAGLAANRTKIVKDFLDATDGEWLWMVDTDMGFAADTVERLIASADPIERPVVGALAFGLKRNGRGDFGAERTASVPTIYTYHEVAETGEVGFRNMMSYPRERLVQCSATGAACVLMHRSALEAIRVKWGDAWYMQLSHPTGNGGAPREFSEDISFCMRLAAVGLPLYVDTSIKTCHEKGGVFLDEHHYDAERRAAEVDRQRFAHIEK